MKQIVFATTNPGKLLEVQNIAKEFSIEIIGLEKSIDIEETEKTLEGNAILKAVEYSKILNMPCISEDTGLIVPTIAGNPGIYSARFANCEVDSETFEVLSLIPGKPTDEQNRTKLLALLENADDRSAYFETVLAYADKGTLIRTFSGKCEGVITKDDLRNAALGMTYDSIFEVLFEDQPIRMSLMTKEQKGKVSHRGKALRKFLEWI
jgi:XTP/dITP diphosphohydrolase